MASGDLARGRVEGVAQLREEDGDRAAAEGPRKPPTYRGRWPRRARAAPRQASDTPPFQLGSAAMPGPLLAVDAPSLLYRAFYALPKTIMDDRAAGQRAARHREPRPAGGRAARAAGRRAVLRRGGRPLPRRALPDLPRRPHRHAEELVPQWRTRPPSSAPSTGPCCATRRSRPTTCSAGSRRSRPTPAGRRCSSPATATCSSASPTRSRSCGRRARARPSRSGPPRSARATASPRAGARLHRAARRSVRRAAGRQGHRREDRRELLTEHGTLDALLALPITLRPRVRQSLTDQADELRAFRRDRDAAADRRRAPARRPDRLRAAPPAPRASAR